MVMSHETIAFRTGYCDKYGYTIDYKNHITEKEVSPCKEMTHTINI